MKQKTFTLTGLFLALFSHPSVAQDYWMIENEGVYFNLYLDDYTAEITGNPFGVLSDIYINEKFYYNGNEFTVTSVANSAFEGCTGLWSISLPKTVTRIGDCAFKGCSSLTSFSMPSNLAYIGESAFQDCSNLQSLHLPGSLKSIGSSAFADCSGITQLTIANGLESIGYAAFQNCRGITWTQLPSSLKEISQGAFWGCGLTWVTIPKNVSSIGGGSFQGCPLSSITVEEGNSTYDSRNQCCAIIETATNKLVTGCKNTIIPNDVSSIGMLAFAEAYDLTFITIPESVTSVGFAAFARTGLTSITVPSNVTYMEDDIFWGCQSLSSVTINARINTLRCYFFGDCPSLQTVSLPSSLESVQQYAFSNCYSLSDIYCYAPQVPNSDPSEAYSVFGGCNLSNITLHVPKKALTNYRNTAPWNEFGNYTALPSTEYSLTYLVDGEVYRNYEVEAGEVVVPEMRPTREGYTFSGWSEIPEIMPAHDVTVYGRFICTTDGIIYNNNEMINDVTLSYARTFNDTNWQALYVPFAMSYDNWKNNFDVAEINNFREYDDNEDGIVDRTTLEVLYKKSGSTLPNTPYLIRAKQTGTKTISLENATLYPAESNSIDCSSLKTKYIFTGTYTGVNGQDMYQNGYYAVEDNALCKALSSEKTVGTFRWYMKPESRTGNNVVTPNLVSIQVIGDDDNNTPDNPAPNGQCATPSIIVSGNKIRFECETPGAEFTSYLTTSEELMGSEVEISNKDLVFTLTVYATAPDYDRSQPATMKFVIKKTDVNGDGRVDVADIATILSEMAAQARAAKEDATE